MKRCGFNFPGKTGGFGVHMKAGQKGFSLIEVMIGLLVFTIGILAIFSMQLSGIKGNSTGRQYTEASTLAMNKIEALMLLPYDADALADTDEDGDDGVDLGLYDVTDGTADNSETDPAGQYTIYWNVAEDDLVGGCKTVSVIVVWNGVGMERTVSMQRVIPEII